MHIKAVFDASRGWGGSGWEKFVPPGGQMTYRGDWKVGGNYDIFTDIPEST